MPVVPSSTYFTTAEGRAADTSFATLTDAQIDSARAEVEDEIESLCGVAFVPRDALATLDGSGTRDLFLPHMHVRGVTAVRIWSDAVTFTDFSTAELADVVPSAEGIVRRSTLGSWPAGFQNIRIAYSHGMDAPSPRVKRASLILFRYRVAQARWRIPSDTAAVDAEGNPTAEGLDVRETNGSKVEGSPTGIPLVDDLLRPWLGRVPVIA